jgi:hypothetical protein
MRQFFSWRYWAAVGALMALVVAVSALNRSREERDAATASPATPTNRRIDLIEPVFSIEAAGGFAMVGGQANSEMRLFLDGERVVRVAPGTPGEIRCAELAELAKCAVAVDLLGDAVVWFALVPTEPRSTITLNAVEDILDDGWVLLANGWEVRHADKVERRCSEETSSLSEFVRRFGERATSTFDFALQTVTRVTCPET